MRTRGNRAWAQLLVVAGAAALLTGCPSYSSMTTAKPVTPGRVEFAISPGAIGLNAAALGSSTGSDTLVLPTVDFGVRYGFHERFDAGLQFSGWGNFGLDGKINFVDSEVFALAFDPSVNGTFFSAGDVDAGFIQFQTPVLIDLAPDDWVRFTLGPRYVGLSAFASSSDSSESDFASFVGSSLGVEFVINDTVRLQPHGGVVTWVNNPADRSVFLFTAGLAIKLRAGKADKPEPAPAGSPPGDSTGPGGRPRLWPAAGRRMLPRMGSKGRPYRTVSVEGFEVLIGRGEEDNDHLTFDVAEPHDLWLHVGGGTPGSHVVVRNPERVEIPRPVIEAAAAYAAWYSKARGSAKVEVHVCRAADVSKPRGAVAGLVELARYKSVRVRPAAPGAGAD